MKQECTHRPLPGESILVFDCTDLFKLIDLDLNSILSKVISCNYFLRLCRIFFILFYFLSEPQGSLKWVVIVGDTFKLVLQLRLIIAGIGSDRKE